MNQLQKVFNYEGAEVRTIIVDGEPWFVVNDVCSVLDFSNSSETVKRLDEDEVSSTEVTDSMGRLQKTNLVNEAGLYSLILGSRKKEARSFKRWIIHEVLPAIRKTGSYSSQSTTPTQALLQTVQLLAEQEQKIREISESQQAHQQRLEILGHRIDNLDGIDVIGNMRQRLNLMIKKYAHEGGFTFSKAWNDFIQSYNMAYRTNLVLLKTHYLMKTGRKNISTPEYLSATEKLEDAIRVADKMLNKAS